MRCDALFGLALCVLGLTLALPAHVRADEPLVTAEVLTDEQVVAAIKAMVAELYERMHPITFWEPRAGYPGSQQQVGGYTALVALALLYAGESYQHPQLRRAIRHLEGAHFRGTYAVAVRTSLWALLPPRFAPNLREDAQWLIDAFSADVGSWTYDHSPSTTRRDNSLRQYGALGLWDAAKRGMRVPPSHWQAIEQNLIDMQLADGGWNYSGSGPATGSMTAAGLALLFITQDVLHSSQSVSLAGQRARRNQQAIERGMQWMHEHFTVAENPGYRTTSNREDYFYYYLYSVERVGLAGGYKYFGGKDWYREGAAELLRRLCDFSRGPGAVRIHEREGGDGRQITNTDLAFALMFLSRGRMPSIINKLQDDSFAWNNRPRDVPNLATWIAGQSARHVLWQITDINAPGEEWLDAPMHMLASNEAVPWVRDATDSRLMNLKQYLDRGGLLFAVSEGSGRAFADSIERAGTRMYPQYQWRTLPHEHWAYTIHQPVRSNQPRLRGLSNGLRELIILAPEGDMPATFQSRNQQNRPHYHTASNIYFYASEMGRPRSRLASLTNAGLEAQPTSSTRSLNIIRVRYEGNWNPEPQAWAAFAEWMRRRHDISIVFHELPLGDIAQFEGAFALAIISGIEPRAFSEVELNAMQRFVRADNVILFETAGGMGDFARAAEDAMRDKTGQEAVGLHRHRIITGNDLPQGRDMTRVDYRPYALDVLGSLDTVPRLRGIIVEDQPKMLFSRDDLSHALLNQPRWGILGYSTSSARGLLSNIVLHILDQEQ